MKSKKKVQKSFFYFTILGRLNKSTNLKSIQNDLGISKQSLNYYLRQLRKDGLIRRKSYGYWEVSKGIEHTKKSSKNNIRGHAFIWTIKFKGNYGNNWEDRLNKFNIKYKLIRGCIPRIIINNRKIWLGKNTITIYEPHSFYGENALESRKYAVNSLLEILGLLELKIDIYLKPYVFKPAREHYGIIKNDLAIQCNRKGEKIHIRDDLEGEWLWIDDSFSMGELETGGKKAMIRNLQVQKWWNDHKKNDFNVTPSFLLKSISGMVEVQQMHSKNIVKHQKVLDEMLITLKKIQNNLTKK